MDNNITIVIRPVKLGQELVYRAFEEDDTPLYIGRPTPEEVQDAVRFHFVARASKLIPVFRQEEQ